jgi:uncharacterized membrane protein YoaK (UPF0700 family)
MASPFSPICSRLPWLLLLLTATTGLVDAGSVLGLGNVFTANMTGNVVFLGFAVTGRPGFHWQSYLAAIVAFMLGALIAGRLARGHGAGSLNRWLIRAALMESCLLWLAALAALMPQVNDLNRTRTLVIIVLTAVAMGLRNATIRQLKIPDLTTTVMTLTITAIAADAGAAGGTNPNLLRRMGGVVAIFCGAAIGAALMRFAGLAAPLALAGATVLAGTLAYAALPAPGDSKTGHALTLGDKL